MKKNVGALTGFGRGGRIASMLATLLLVLSLISGVGAFVPAAELSDLDDVLTVDLVLAEEPAIEGEDAFARIGGRVAAAESCAFERCFGFLSTGTVRPSGQVVAMLRNSGIQRAVHPTGPPTL